MGASFCVKCGQPLPPGAQFCSSCGTPVPATTGGPGPAAPTPGGPGAPSMDPAFAPPGLPLADQLGLHGGRQFLLQHLLVGSKHSYRVLDGAKRHLCTFGEDWPAERAQALGRFFHPSTLPPGVHVQFHVGPPEVTWYWAIDDFAGQLRGTVAFEQRGRHGQATVSDAAGAPSFVVRVSPSGLTGLEAGVVRPDGRPLFEARGSLMHHNFSVHDAQGTEVAKVHEAWASVRDTFVVDLVGAADPLGVLMLAVVIDRLKGN